VQAIAAASHRHDLSPTKLGELLHLPRRSTSPDAYVR
jgi:hypothetical protein